MAYRRVALLAVARSLRNRHIRDMRERRGPDSGVARTPVLRRRWTVLPAVVCMLAGAGYVLSQRSSAPQSKGRTGRNAGGGAIPVSVTTVKKGNIGVYVNAL